ATPTPQSPISNPQSPTPQSPISNPQSPTPQSPISNLQSPTPCASEICIYPGHFWLARPITPPGRDTVDPTYRYGSTQVGLRETHHGVELVNSQGTPVLAAADGLVIVAGNDNNAIYSDWPYFYGNLVIIKHQFPNLPVDQFTNSQHPIYTLYGHLYEVQVDVGQRVSAGDQIGLVGFTGTAEGSHLHFEVRAGENDYAHTRNPELWLCPHTDENSELRGAIAGRMIDEFGSPIYIPSVVIERLSPNGEGILETIYLETYADHTVNGDDVWQESFAVGDLRAGMYRLTFVARGLQVYELEVQPGMVTVVAFDARNQ
ncbi:MAG: M23 family metallopeptidase, partial [Chloroflexi bacterium]|nr:M23 family metallopeptidase [Chloroflexota bacterium]